MAAGGTLTATNKGGEFHTFTEVAAFGGGCVDELNDLLGLTPVPECAQAPGIFFSTGAGRGGSTTTGPLAAGTHRFLCLIHPWMTATVTAKRTYGVKPAKLGTSKASDRSEQRSRPLLSDRLSAGDGRYAASMYVQTASNELIAPRPLTPESCASGRISRR